MAKVIVLKITKIAIAEKMPNAVDDFGKALGAFVTPLDELVALAEQKYGLGSEDEATVLGVTKKMSNAVIGITLGMLVDIGDLQSFQIQHGCF